MKLISNDFRRQFFRFYEIYDIYTKKDGRRQLFFKDEGYVQDIDLFITGCLSGLPVSLIFDGSKLEWEVLNGIKKIKTIIDFYENKITCQGKLFKEIEEGYLRDRFKNMEIDAFVINPGATDYDKLKDFLKI